MHNHQPGTESVAQSMQTVSIRDAVDGGVEGDSEEQDVCDHAHSHASGDARNHVACAEGFDEENIRHYGGDVVVGGERSEPVDR